MTVLSSRNVRSTFVCFASERRWLMLLQNWPIYSLVVSISLSLCSVCPVIAQNSVSVGSSTTQADEDVPIPGSVQVPGQSAVGIPRQSVAQLPGDTQSSQAPPAKL